jgi:nucleoid-associated protein YgaU
LIVDKNARTQANTYKWKESSMRRSAATTVLSGAVAAVLSLVRPHPVAVSHRLASPALALRQAGTDALLAEVSATLLWFVAAWLALGIVATLLASTPGLAGRLFGAASRRLLPAAVRRIVAGSAGLGVLLAPVPAAIATSAAPIGQPVAAALPAPVWPGAASPVHRPDPPPAPAKRSVRVRPGDSLWLIAAHRLGPNARPADVAAAWPRWYAANRDVIGADPDLIRPGQLLTPPDIRHPNGPHR